MKNLLTNLWTARVLVIVGFLLGWGSIGATVGHVGNDLFLLVEGAPVVQTHSWHHFFRELGGDFAAMGVILMILFAAPRFRTPLTWWVAVILMFGFYAPFWIGVPFMAELAAPNMGAEINHLSMSIPVVLGCFLARRHFLERPETA